MDANDTNHRVSAADAPKTPPPGTDIVLLPGESWHWKFGNPGARIERYTDGALHVAETWVGEGRYTNTGGTRTGGEVVRIVRVVEYLPTHLH